MLQVGLLLGTTESLTALGLSLLLVFFIVFFGAATGTLSLVVGNTLTLGLLAGGGGGGSLGLGLLSLLSLLAFYLGVLSSIPGVKDLKGRTLVGG